VVVERAEVIAEEMIKEGILLNPALDAVIQDGQSLTDILLAQAMAKRDEIKIEYEKLGVNINPLLLIQLPNDEKEDNTPDDEKYIRAIEHLLGIKYNCTLSNNKLAIWLSNNRKNVDGIEAPANMVDVLLFKQAIALGWDCPRAAVLLIFRELKSTNFTIQVVGRVLRMPEQKHYPSAILNQGYVFTNLSKDKIAIVQDDMNYLTMNKARRMANYERVMLNSAYINTPIERNRLGASFKKALFFIAERNWNLVRELGVENFYGKNKELLKARFINIDVSSIEIALPENVVLSGGLEVKSVAEMARFARTQDELNILFRIFCKNNVGQFAPVDSTPTLEMALKFFFEDYFGFNEFEAVKIILYDQNQTQFIELIEKSLERYNEVASTSRKDVQNYDWEVPAERIYNELYDEKSTKQNALIPYYQYVKASTPEREFVSFLANNSIYLKWWYQNGANAKEHFAVPYTNHLGKQSLFYVDFVILTNSGTTCLFDTKTKGSDAADAHLKHNALVDFIAVRNSQGLKTIGGVIIPNEVNNNITWRYCIHKIKSTEDLTNWDFFNPADFAKG
ncbi:MAG: restriction endonuclease subunit R, partial [Taibaiella sp.]|nr:restriction endonuclease subunit R [Taibaiella sp.]